MNKIAIIPMMLAFLTISCSDGIPGNPEKVVERYVEATKKGDFDTLFELNRITARQNKYIKSGESGDNTKLLEMTYEKHKTDYQNVEPGAFTGALWAEKFFFPPSSATSVSKPRHPPAAPDDPVNAEYERGFTVFVTVATQYPNIDEAPALRGKKLKSANYDCTLTKIREGANVRVYSDDEKWILAGCFLEESSVSFYN